MGDDPHWADPAFDDSSWPAVPMPEAADQPSLGFSWYRFRVRLPETMPKEPLALMIGGFGSSQAYEVFWNGQRAGAMGEPDGGAGGLLISVPKAIPVASHGRDAVVAIRLRVAMGLFILTYRRTSWIGTEASIQERVETWRGERFTFVSDGVVEAENAQRELIGFDRTRQISGKSAQEIAQAEKTWGQNDDITVVTVQRIEAQ